MQKHIETLQALRKKMKKNKAALADGLKKSLQQEELLLGLGHGSLAEFLQVLHQIKGSLAGAGTGGLVTLNNLSLSVQLESGDFSIDFFDKLFHN